MRNAEEADMKTSYILILLALFIHACGGDGKNNSRSNSPEDTSLKPINIPTSEGVFDGLTAGQSSGTPVLLLHGFPTTAEQYIDIMNTLADEGYYVVAPNLRGFSEGVRPSDPDSYHPAIRAEDVIKIVDQLGIYRFHLVGHDSGALNGWLIAAMHPDRLMSLTAISVPHPRAIIDAFFDDSAILARRVGYVDDFLSEGAAEAFVENDHEYMRWIYEDTPAESIDVYIEKLGTVETVDAILNYYRTRDWTWILANAAAVITVPTMQIWGDDDSYVSISSMEYSENYVSAEYSFEILEGVSHWVTETAAEEVSLLLLDHFEGRY